MSSPPADAERGELWEAGSPKLTPTPPVVRLIPAREHERLLRAFRDLAPTGGNLEPRLRAVLRDTVEHPGSFLRAQIAFEIAGRSLDCRAATSVAIGIEYFHTASLLFDDLPMMDDARERRGRPCPHRLYGEAAAVLAALALINEAYRLVWGVLADLPDDRSRRAAEVVTACLGAGGVLGGQARDLALSPDSSSEVEIRGVALEKTVPLIRLTLALPAIAAGVGGEVLETLNQLATSWGLAYQILDDCRDALMGPAETGKSTSRDGILGRPNLLNHSGAARTLEQLEGLMRRSRVSLRALTNAGCRFGTLEGLQRLLETESVRVRGRLSSVEPAPGVTRTRGRREAVAC